MAFADIEVMGNLGSDPEMRYTPNGKAVASFSVAVTHRGRDAATGEWADQGTDWYRCSSWGDQAERHAEQLSKGRKVLVKGRFKTREFEGKDGQKRTSLEITVDRLIDLTPRQRDDEGGFQGAPAGRQSQPARQSAGSDYDDLPF